jgi:hypothetical protein
VPGPLTEAERTEIQRVAAVWAAMHLWPRLEHPPAKRDLERLHVHC